MDLRWSQRHIKLYTERGAEAREALIPATRRGEWGSRCGAKKRIILIYSADSCDSARRESQTRASPRLGQPRGARRRPPASQAGGKRDV